MISFFFFSVNCHRQLANDYKYLIYVRLFVCEMNTFNCIFMQNKKKKLNPKINTSKIYFKYINHDFMLNNKRSVDFFPHFRKTIIINSIYYMDLAETAHTNQTSVKWL